MQPRTRNRLVFAAVLVSATWAAAFVVGLVNPSPGWNTLQGGVQQAIARTLAPAPMKWHYGQELPADAQRVVRAQIADAKTLLVLHTPDDPRSLVDRRYPRLLAQRFQPLGLKVAYTADSLTSDDLADALKLDQRRPATLLIDRDGTIRYATPGVLSSDQLRQLVERNLLGDAPTKFADVPSSAAAWTERLNNARFRAAGDSSVVTFGDIAGRAQQLLVLDASCSSCVIERHLKIAVRADSMARVHGQRMALVVPEGYVSGLASIALGGSQLRVLTTRESISPELAYMTRDVPEAAPVLLTLDHGRVSLVSRLAETR